MSVHQRFLVLRMLAAFASIFVVCLLTPSSALSQEVEATLFGTITDPAGAAVPRAKVIVTNTDTGIAVTSLSHEDGTYIVTSLRPGNYALMVEQTGFATTVHNGIKLNVAQKAQVDVRLKVGAMATEVQVTGAAPLVETATATVSMNVNTRQVTELPLNVRRFGSLPLLMPGTVPDRGGFSSNIFGSPFSEDTYAANGARGSGNNVLIDGVDAKNMFTGGFSIQPSVDAVQEFNVQTESFSAVYGKNAGSTINLAMKSGTNDIHGVGFEFLRNDHLDARNFFDYPIVPGANPKPSFKRNQFGGYIGGPIKKNKTFFYGGYESLIYTKGLTSLDTVPTAKMINGDFSELCASFDGLGNCTAPAPGVADTGNTTGQLIDPTTGNNIPFNNVAGKIDSVAQKVLPYFPAPTSSGLFNNYLAHPIERRHDHQFSVKIDHTFSSKDTIFGHYLFGQSIIHSTNQAYTTLPGFADRIRYRGQNIALSWTHTFSPTMLNEARLGFSRNMDIGTCENCPRKPGFMDSFGIKNLHALSAADEGFPFFGFNNYTGIGDSNYRPVESNDMVEKLNDTLTINKGRHTIAAGADIQPYQALRNQAPFSPHGQFGFDGSFTGWDFADFMLGYPANGGRSIGKAVNNHSGRFWNAFVQDDYRISSNLTFNMGLRYEYHQLPIDRRNIGAALFRIPDMPIQTPGNALLVLPTYAQADALCNLPQYIADYGQPDAHRLIACSSDMKKYGFTGRTARSLWFPDHFNWAPRLGLSWRPLSSDKLVVHAGYGLFFELSEFNVFHYGFNNPVQAPDQDVNFDTSTLTKIEDAFAKGGFIPLSQAFVSINVDPHFRQPYIHEWTLNLQNQLTSNTAIELRYLGLSAIQMSHFHFFGNQAIPCGMASTCNDTPGDIQRRRLYPDFGVTAETGSGANASYNSLQAQLTRRMTRGLNMTAAYTWAKQLDNNEGEEGGYVTGNLLQDDLHQGNEKGRGVNDARQRFVMSSMWELPLGQGRRWLNGGGIANLLLGGWEATGILSLQTGFPLTVVEGFDDFSAIGSLSAGSERPDRVCNGGLPVDQRTPDHWYDVSCFTTAALQAALAAGHPRFGNSGRGILDGPGIQNLDFALLKNFHLGERVTAQFRAETFNTFNHANFGDPDMNITSGSAATITSAGEPRNIQFGLKFLW